MLRPVLDKRRTVLRAQLRDPALRAVVVDVPTPLRRLWLKLVNSFADDPDDRTVVLGAELNVQTASWRALEDMTRQAVAHDAGVLASLGLELDGWILDGEGPVAIGDALSRLARAVYPVAKHVAVVLRVTPADAQSEASAWLTKLARCTVGRGVTYFGVVEADDVSGRHELPPSNGPESLERVACFRGVPPLGRGAGVTVQNVPLAPWASLPARWADALRPGDGEALLRDASRRCLGSHRVAALVAAMTELEGQKVVRWAPPSFPPRSASFLRDLAASACDPGVRYEIYLRDTPPPVVPAVCLERTSFRLDAAEVADAVAEALATPGATPDVNLVVMQAQHALTRERYADASEFAAQAVSLATDPAERALSLLTAGNVALVQRNLDEAREALVSAVTVCVEDDVPAILPLAFVQLAHAHDLRGELSEARACYAAAAEHFERMGVMHASVARMHEGDVLERMAHPAEAEALWVAAERELTSRAARSPVEEGAFFRVQLLLRLARRREQTQRSAEAKAARELIAELGGGDVILEVEDLVMFDQEGQKKT